MKRAFVLSEQGVCNIYFIRDERPRIQWLIDLGIPNFTCFMLELPIPEDNPAHVQIVFNEGTALLLQQIQVFLSENEFGNDAGLLQSIMDAIHDTEIDYAGTDLMYGYEILFTLSSEFYQLVMNRLVRQKVAGREEDISKAVWRGPDTSKRVTTQDWEKGVVQKRDKKQLEDAKSIINRYKQTIYKNTPGPLYVIMYDRNGMPRAVNRVTNRGLTKWAGWGQWIRGEYWVDGSDVNNAVECDQGDHNHVSYATQVIEDDKRDEILAVFREYYQKAVTDSNEPEEVEEQFNAVVSGEIFSREAFYLWDVLPKEAKERIYNNDSDLYRTDIRVFFMKHYDQIHVIDSNFGVWNLTPQNLNTIIDWVFQEAKNNGGDPESLGGEVLIEQVGERKWASIPIEALIHMKQPGQVWRYSGMAVASKAAAGLFGCWWIKPDGTVIVVPQFTDHWEIAAKELGYPSASEDPMSFPEEALYDAIYQGWVRCTMDQRRIYFELKKLTRETLHRIQTFLGERDGVTSVCIEEDPTGDRRDVTVPFDDLMTTNNPNQLWRLNRVASVGDLKDLIKIQTADGNWDYDPYMHGMANGMILSEAVVEDQDPQFLEAPDKWIADKVSRKTAMSVMEAVEEAAEQVHEELQHKPKPWQTPAFKQWFGDSKVVNPDGSPKRVMHGTTHNFDQFAPVGQNVEGWYGGGYYFTDCPQDVSENYGTASGTDLTNRIERLAEQILDDYRDNNGEGHNFNPEEEIEGFDPEDDPAYGTPMYKALHDAAERKAKQMMAGQSSGHVVPVFLKIENPVVVSAKGGTRLPGGDSGFNNPDDEDDYTDGEEDTRLYEAWEDTCSTFDAYKPESAWERISELAMDGSLTAMEFEKTVRSGGAFAGGSGPALAHFYELLGYDGIIMDASTQFTTMKMSPGTRHYIVWDPKRIKSATGNSGKWDSKSPLLTAGLDNEEDNDTRWSPVFPKDEDAEPGAPWEPLRSHTPKSKSSLLTAKMADDPAVDSLPVPSGHMPNYRVSPRIPKAPVVKYDQGGGIKPFKGQPREDAFAPKRLQPGLETMLSDPTKLKKNVDLMRQYPNFGKLKTDAAKAADQIIEMMKDNLVWLFEQWEEHRDRSKLWYVGGNELVHRWAKRFNLEPHQIAGVLAAMSPERPWFGNVTLAERFLVAMQRKDELKWDKKMSNVLDGLNDKQSGHRAAVEGKSLAEVDGPTEEDMWNMTLWIKCWDLAHNPRGCRVLTPEGNFGETWKTEKGRTETANIWKYFDHVIKSIKILRDGSLEDISNTIGQNHKVRSFYNNLIAPLDEEDVTIDTHAVAAALLRPLGTSDIEVTHNFGGKGTADSVSGSTGLYGLYAEAYRRAAKQMGVLAREMQSVTWEAVRGLFKSSLKRSIKEQANAVWLAYTRGEADANATRLKIKDIGKGFDQPTWVGPHTTTIEDTGDSSYQGKLSSLIRPRLQSEGVSRGRDRILHAVRASNGASERSGSELLKTAALRFNNYTRGSHHDQTDATLEANIGKFMVGSVNYCIYKDEVHVQDVHIGNEVLTRLQTSGLMGRRLKGAIERKEVIGRELMKQLQREYPDKDLRLSESDLYPDLEYDEVESEYAPLLRERMELEAQKAQMDQRWDQRRDQPERDPLTQEETAAYNAVLDRRWEIDQELNIYPTPSMKKRLVRTSLLQRHNS